MDRTNFYTIVNIGNGPEYDHLHNSLSKFQVFYPLKYYRLAQDDLVRPDLVSYKAYGSVRYWWLIMMINKIGNVFADMEVGDLIKIPNILDIYTFYKKFSIR